MHIRLLVRSLSITVCRLPAGGGAGGAAGGAGGPAPLSPGSQLQVFQRDTSFTFLKTKQLSCLNLK